MVLGLGTNNESWLMCVAGGDLLASNTAGAVCSRSSRPARTHSLLWRNCSPLPGTTSLPWPSPLPQNPKPHPSTCSSWQLGLMLLIDLQGQRQVYHLRELHSGLIMKHMTPPCRPTQVCWSGRPALPRPLCGSGPSACCSCWVSAVTQQRPLPRRRRRLLLPLCQTCWEAWRRKRLVHRRLPQPQQTFLVHLPPFPSSCAAPI